MRRERLDGEGWGWKGIRAGGGDLLSRVEDVRCGALATI